LAVPRGEGDENDPNAGTCLNDMNPLSRESAYPADHARQPEQDRTHNCRGESRGVKGYHRSLLQQWALRRGWGTGRRMTHRKSLHADLVGEKGCAAGYCRPLSYEDRPGRAVRTSSASTPIWIRQLIYVPWFKNLPAPHRRRRPHHQDRKA